VCGVLVTEWTEFLVRHSVRMFPLILGKSIIALLAFLTGYDDNLSGHNISIPAIYFPSGQRRMLSAGPGV
jgi:hypothetical protein